MEGDVTKVKFTQDTLDQPPTVKDVVDVMKAIQSDMAVTIPVVNVTKETAKELFDVFRNNLNAGCTQRGATEACAESSIPTDTEAAMETYMKQQMTRVSPKIPIISSLPVVKLVPQELTRIKPTQQPPTFALPLPQSREQHIPLSHYLNMSPPSAAVTTTQHRRDLTDMHPRISGFVSMDLMEEAGANKKFRNVVWTGNMQMAYMHLNENEEIGIESHDEDQFFFVVSGAVHVLCNGDDSVATSGWGVLIPAKSVHNLKAITSDAHLITIYAPPHHPHGTVVDRNPNKLAPSSSGGGYASVFDASNSSSSSSSSHTPTITTTTVTRTRSPTGDSILREYTFEEGYGSNDEVLSEMEGMSSLGSDLDENNSDGIDMFSDGGGDCENGHNGGDDHFDFGTCSKDKSDIGKPR